MKLARLFSSHWPIIVIIFLAATLRFWRLEALTTFGGDQGYDFLIVKKILEGDLTLLGPKIGPYNELGNLYLGPAYYYLLAPVLFLFHLDPIGPAFLTVIFSLITIFLIYLICIQFFSKLSAIVASGLYSVSSLLIDQSRAASNPHFIPFFSALIIYSVLKIRNGSKSKIWPILTGVSCSVAFQLHYLSVSLILAALFALSVKKHFREIIFVAVSFFIGLSGQILFELRNDFFVSRLFIRQVQAGSGSLSFNSIIDNFFKSFQKFFEILTGFNIPYMPVAVILLLAFFIILFKYSKENYSKIKILFTIIILNLLLLSLYWGNVNLHYLAPSYVAIFILSGLIIVSSLRLFSHPFLKTLVILLVLEVITANLQNTNLHRQEGYTMAKGWNLLGTKKASEIVAFEAKNENFNIAATLDGDTRAMPYRYLLNIYKIESQGVENYPESDKLYLISRDDQDKIKEYTVWEVASFSPIKIENSWDIQNGIKLYKISRDKSI